MYKKLREAWQNEKTNPEIQRLEPDFYRKAANYLRTIKEQLSSSQESSPIRTLLLNELRISKRLLTDLLNTRHGKLLAMVQDSMTPPVEHLAEEEANLVGGILDFSRNFDTLRKALPEGELEQPSTQAKTEGKALPETRRIVVRLTQDLPAIVGVDLETYGPFKAEDIASIPEENALGLVAQGAAKRITLAAADR